MGLNRSFADGSLDAIYDVTIAYPDNLPEKEEDITRGKFPKEVHFYIRRYEQTSSTMTKATTATTTTTTTTTTMLSHFMLI